MKIEVADQMQQPDQVSALVAEEEPVSVLFIEDDPQIAEMFRLKLQTDGYQVTIAESGEGIPRALPDLIFLDIRAPHRERIGVLRTLRDERATSAIPVVIVSDYPKDDLIAAGAKLGQGAYLIRSDGPTSLRPV